MLDAPRPPATVLAPELADADLELGRDLIEAARRAVRAVDERGQSPCLVAGDPGVQLWRETASRSATSVTFQPSCTTASTAC